MTYFTDEPDHIRALRDQLKRFMADKAPREKRRAWDKAHTWPRDLFRELSDLGLMGLTIPEEFGGAGQDIVAAVAVIEELARAGPALAGPFIHCAFYGGMNIAENGSPEQKAELLPKLAKGELLFAYGLSEPDVGGDLASVKTRAWRDGDEIVVRGSKRWCTGADFADYLYCLVNSDPDAGRYKNLTFLLIPPSTKGVSLSPIEHVNLRYTLSSDVHFDDVRLPLSAIVGGEAMWNQGWKVLAGRALDVEKLEVAAVTYGLAAATIDEATSDDLVQAATEAQARGVQVTAGGTRTGPTAAGNRPPAPSRHLLRGYIDHVLQADEGADMDFLVGQRGAAVPKDNH
jgi:alkylation response protein AidB-like acyl-CoA dehydrogenase